MLLGMMGGCVIEMLVFCAVMCVGLVWVMWIRCDGCGIGGILLDSM
jgi:hypothetical protein